MNLTIEERLLLAQLLDARIEAMALSVCALSMRNKHPEAIAKAKEEIELLKSIRRKIVSEDSYICKFCGKDMQHSNGCAVRIVRIDGTDYARIPVGGAHDYHEHFRPDARCNDCGAKKGFYHHPHCDMERCPRCGGQILSCDCPISYPKEVKHHD